MAAERAGDAALSGEEVDLAVDQLEESNAGPAIRGTLAKVSGRLSGETNGEVCVAPTVKRGLTAGSRSRGAALVLAAPLVRM